MRVKPAKVPYVGCLTVFPVAFGDERLFSEYDQEIRQSKTAEKPMVSRGRATQQEDKLSKATSSLFPIKMIAKLEWECRTKHPGTKHPVPFFYTPDKTSRIDLPPRTKRPMQFLLPRTKHPMQFLPPRTKHPMPFLPPRTKHPSLCLKPMKVHKTSHLVNCHYY